MKLTLTITINLAPIAPTLRLMRDGALRPAGARAVRWLAGFLHPFDSARVHITVARALGWLERA